MPPRILPTPSEFVRQRAVANLNRNEAARFGQFVTPQMSRGGEYAAERTIPLPAPLPIQAPALDFQGNPSAAYAAEVLNAEFLDLTALFDAGNIGRTSNEIQGQEGDDDRKIPLFVSSGVHVPPGAASIRDISLRAAGGSQISLQTGAAELVNGNELSAWRSCAPTRYLAFHLSEVVRHLALRGGPLATAPGRHFPAFGQNSDAANNGRVRTQIESDGLPEFTQVDVSFTMSFSWYLQGGGPPVRLAGAPDSLGFDGVFAAVGSISSVLEAAPLISQGPAWVFGQGGCTNVLGVVDAHVDQRPFALGGRSSAPVSCTARTLRPGNAPMAAPVLRGAPGNSPLTVLDGLDVRAMPGGVFAGDPNRTASIDNVNQYGRPPINEFPWPSIRITLPFVTVPRWAEIFEPRPMNWIGFDKRVAVAASAIASGSPIRPVSSAHPAVDPVSRAHRTATDAPVHDLEVPRRERRPEGPALPPVRRRCV